MNDKSMDELLAAAARVGDAELTELDLDGLDDQLRWAITSSRVVESVNPVTTMPSANSRWRLTRRALAVAAVVAVVGAAIIASPLGRSSSSAWATEILAVAEASPRLLVDLSGWTVVRADEFSVEYGEMEFSDGTQKLSLKWRGAETHDAHVADRAANLESPRETTTNGLPGTEFRYPGTTDFTTLWLDGDHSFEARGVFPDRAAYEAILAALNTTDVDTWLNAMPVTVVKPDSREAVIAAMLEGIPLPRGFDATALETSSGVSDRYQLGAHVAGAVTCEWIEQWIDAREAGDTAAKNEAVTAMQSSHDWAILHEMAQSGGYSQVLWEYVDSIAANGTVPGERPMNVMESSEHALGCDQ